MIDTLLGLLPEIRKQTAHVEEWDSLIITRRKPHTYRVFRRFGEYRVCLHRFEPCGPDECFAHPHPWPGAFLMLEGEYVHRVGYSNSLESEPTFLFTERVRPYSAYEIVDRQTWHSIQPLKTTWTVMVNGAPWKIQHAETRTPKGKDLERMDQKMLREHLSVFSTRIGAYERFAVAKDV